MPADAMPCHAHRRASTNCGHGQQRQLQEPPPSFLQVAEFICRRLRETATDRQAEGQDARLSAARRSCTRQHPP
eukprot:3992249-Pleurochrysis_carterae.AAC.1